MRVKWLTPLFAIFLVRLPLAAQNLVPNPSFECGEDLCNANTRAEFYSTYACDWNCPNHGTSDVFSITNTNKQCWASMPSYNEDFNYYIGSQLPRTGNRFAGIYTYGSDPFGVAYREYLQARLTEPLVPGEVYCTELYVSKAEAVYYAANNIGISFSPDIITSPPRSYQELNLIPTILHAAIVTDTSNWVKISGAFKPTETARYIVIGNFFDDSETIVVPTATQPGFYGTYSYYFVDDVAVEKLPYDYFTFDGNTNICLGDLVKIHANVGTNYVTWTTLSDTSTVVATGPTLNHKPDTTSYYRVTAKGCNKTVTDTVAVIVHPLPEIDLGQDTTICEGSHLTLVAGDDMLDHVWHDQSTNSHFIADRAGRYSVTVTDHFGCKAYDEIRINIRPLPTIDLGQDTLVCHDVFFPLKAGSDFDSYEWSTGTTDSTYLPATSGEYWVSVRDRCGEASDTITVLALDDLFIPNVLTLNNDTLNRYLEVRGAGSGHRGTMTIFNRWGQEIYSSYNYPNDWPKHPDNVPTGTYYYTYKYPGCPPRKGWVRLMR